MTKETPCATEDVTREASAVIVPYQDDRSRNIGWQMFQRDVLIPKALGRTGTSWVASSHKCSRDLHMSSWLVGVHEVAILTNKRTG